MEKGSSVAIANISDAELTALQCDLDASHEDLRAKRKLVAQEMERRAAMASAQKKLGDMSSSELAAVAQLLAPTPIASAEVVGTPGA